MNLTFNTVVGGSTTTSYVTVADADTYFSKTPTVPNVIEWASQTSSTKQVMLMTATRNIDKHYFDGVKAEDEQALQFPRNFQTSTTTIPCDIEYAACEEAFTLLQLQTNLSLNEAQRAQEQGIKSEKYGHTAVTYSGNYKGRYMNSLKAFNYLNFWLARTGDFNR